ncbi:MAG: DUF3106 domain-containing protein [Pseudomonadota bacterium]
MAGIDIRSRLQACLATLALFVLVAPFATAQQVAKPPAAAKASTPLLVPITPAKTWKQLTPAQRLALQPLAAQWDRMEGARREKWLGIANRFANMTPDEQRRVHERMRVWSTLSPEERRVARENYTRSKQIAPNSKSEKWEQYQQLPEEEKKKLAAAAAAAKSKPVKPAAKLPPPKANGARPPAARAVPAASPRVPESACPAGTTKNPSAPLPACVPAPVAPAPTTTLPPVTPAAPAPHAK